MNDVAHGDGCRVVGVERRDAGRVPAQVSRIERVTAGAIVDEVNDGTLIVDIERLARSGSAEQPVLLRQDAHFAPRHAGHLYRRARRRAGVIEVRAWLAGDQHASAGREVDGGKLIDQQTGRVPLLVGAPAQHSVDMVQTVDNEEHLALGVHVAAGLDCGGERFGGGREPRPQIDGRLGRDVFKLSQETPDDDVGKDAFVPVDVGGSKPAVMAGNNPVRVPVGVGELFTQPRLPHTGFADDDNTATSGRDGVDVLAHFGCGTDAGHGDGCFDGVSFGDGTEVGGEPDLG